jgi:glycosyltransferase involved in cell wall biosynthesis
VIRNPNQAPGRAALICAKLLGLRVVLYTQTPQRVDRVTAAQLAKHLAARALRTPWMTPVEFRGAVRPDRQRPGLQLVPFPIEPAPGPRVARRSGEAVRMLAVGKFVARKNHALTIELIANASWRDLVQLTIVGEVSSPAHWQHFAEITELVHRHGLSHTICLLPNVRPDDMGSIYLSHDVLVFPAAAEPAAFCVLEALSNGLFVVASSDNGTSSYVLEDGRGVIVDFADRMAATRALAHAIHTVTNRDLGKRSYHMDYAERLLQLCRT